MTHTFYELAIPANTPADDLAEILMALDYGILTHVDIIIPDGQMGVAKLRILYHERPLFPWNRGAWYKGDGSQISLNCFVPIMVEPYEFKAQGYNEGEEEAHSFLMAFNVQRPEELGLSDIDFLIQYNLKKLEGEIFNL
jgi:hypothetical protein